VIEALFTDIFDDRKLGFFLAVLFFVLAFGMLKSRPNGNIFLFSAGSITTTCFYVIPNIINSLLLCFIVHGQFTGKDILAGRHWAIGLMCLLVFLAQFSMTPSSILSSTYAGFVLLYKYLTQASKGILHKTKQFVAGLTTYDCILILAVLFWIIAAICDMNGGRYNKIRNDEWNFSAALDTFSALMTQFNIVTSVVAFVIFIVTFLRMVWKHKTGRWTNKDVDYLNVIRTSFLSMVMILAFLLLVSSHTSARLIGRMSAAYSLFFLAVLSLLFCIAFLLSEKPKLRYIAPIIFVLLLVEATNPERPYANGQGTPHHKAIIQGWVNGIIQADRIGKKDATIQVPVAEWPHPASNLGPRISRTLFAHGVTERRMHIAIEEDPSLANANNWRTILGNEK
jgi:hypothetical protein